MNIGDQITVEVRNDNRHRLVWRPETEVYHGQLVANGSWLGDDVISMTSDLPNGFVRSIRRDMIVRLVTAEQAVPLPSTTQAEPADQQWSITGSRGSVYTVTLRAGHYGCNCAAGQFGKNLCRHIKTAQASLAA